MPACARTLQEPGCRSRVAGRETPNSSVGAPLRALGASGLSWAGCDCCPLPGEATDPDGVPRVTVRCPSSTLCGGKPPMLCSTN